MGGKVANPIGIQVFNFLTGRESGANALSGSMKSLQRARSSAVGRFFLRLENCRGLAGIGDVSALRLQRQVISAPADDPLAELGGVVAGFGEGVGRHRRAVAATAV